MSAGWIRWACLGAPLPFQRPRQLCILATHLGPLLGLILHHHALRQSHASPPVQQPTLLLPQLEPELLAVLADALSYDGTVSAGGDADPVPTAGRPQGCLDGVHLTWASWGAAGASLLTWRCPVPLFHSRPPPLAGATFLLTMRMPPAVFLHAANDAFFLQDAQLQVLADFTDRAVDKGEHGVAVSGRQRLRVERMAAGLAGLPVLEQCLGNRMWLAVADAGSTASLLMRCM